MKNKKFELRRLLRVINEKNISVDRAVKIIKSQAREDFDPYEEIMLTIDYSLSLKEMIKAGNYHRSHHDITEKNFPLDAGLLGKKVTVPAKLFHFNKIIKSKNVISKMKKKLYRPATLPELLTLVKLRDESEKRFPIVALGSIWNRSDNNRFVPVLYPDGMWWELRLSWFGLVWNDCYRFLAVCK